MNLTRNIEFNQSMVHSHNRQNAIVLLSGGIDSTVSLFWALYNYERVKAITIDYNQPHSIEIEYTKQIAKITGIQHDVIKVDFPRNYWGLQNYLTRGQACLSIALAALDISHEGADIVLGILSTDYYPDCDRDFLDNVASVLDHPKDYGGIGIATPLKGLKSKRDVIAFGYQLGVPLELTWTCRHPIDRNPCLMCEQCLERINAFSEFYRDYDITEEIFTTWQSLLGGYAQPIFKKNIEEGINRDLHILGNGFIRAGGLNNSLSVGMKYKDPEGRERLASLIKRLPNRGLARRCKGTFVNHLAVHGFMEDGKLWEFDICEDGSFASTDMLPSLDTLEKALVRKASRIRNER